MHTFQNRFPHITTLAAYGCSMTAGAELGDHILTPKAESVKRRKGFDNWWNNVVANADPELKQLWWEAEQAGAWPKLAADLMDLDVVNRARGGTALGSAVWQFEEDLLMSRLDPKTTLFVFGVTNVPRIKLFDPSPMKTLRIGNPTGKPKYWCDRTITDIVTDGYMLWNHLQLLERIHGLAQRQNLTIAVFNMFAPEPPVQYDTISREDLPLFEHQWNRLNTLPGFFLQEPSMSNLTKEDEKLGCGHPNHQAHERFAQHVTRCLDRLV